MTVRMGIDLETGKVSFSMGPLKARKEDLKKWLGRNDDAVLVKLNSPDSSPPCSAGHLCRIEQCDDNSGYNVFVGKHLIGQLPDEAISFADRVDSSPDCLISIVGKVEDSDVFIYIAE